MDPPPPFLTAFQDATGLKLNATKGPVEFLVVDHADKPSADLANAVLGLSQTPIRRSKSLAAVLLALGNGWTRSDRRAGFILSQTDPTTDVVRAKAPNSLGTAPNLHRSN